MIRLSAAAVVLAATLTTGCKGKSYQSGGDVGNWAPSDANTIKGVPKAEVAAAIQARASGKAPPGVPSDRWGHVTVLYRAFGGGPLWLHQDGFDDARATGLLRSLLQATNDGIRLDLYDLGELTQAVAAVRAGSHSSAAELANADVMLTLAYVELAEDMLTGQTDPRSVTTDWHINAQHERIDSAAAASLRQGDVAASIARMRPNDPEYEALRQQLGNLRKVASAGGWNRVPAGVALKPGDTDVAARLTALRQRLAAEGISVPAAPTDTQTASARGGRIRARAATPGRAVYDRGLAGAVATFQERHGIVVDSMLGQETVDALNVPATYRLGQIAANLERYRWLPRALGNKYIFVNVPAFRLQAFEGGEPKLEMKVIVGQEYEGKSTPVFSDSMETVVFRPYWNVTPTIQAKELEPKIAADPGFMAANDYEYFNDNGRTGIRQRPGDKNALGMVKFLFPNNYNIYLHDTPEHSLFDKDIRAFSHGCIRAEKPTQLAEWVLGWDEGQVQAAEHGADNHSVRLPRKIPVYITYFTTYTRNGTLYFGNDLYSRDQDLVKAVWPGAYPSPEAVQQIAQLQKLVED